MDYGVERDCEYCIQILSSESMERDVCRRFNLMELRSGDLDDRRYMKELIRTFVRAVYVYDDKLTQIWEDAVAANDFTGEFPVSFYEDESNLRNEV